VDNWLLWPLASLVLLPQIMTKLSVTVEAVADVMARNLHPGGAYARRRVGIRKA